MPWSSHDPESQTQPPAPQLVTFQSPDGIAIGCYRSGTGPALVAIHGTGADHTSLDLVAPALARNFTVYAMDRRGRGASGDTPDYSLEREIADALAVVEGIERPVHLYGHSFGGACAIEVAMRTSHLASLTLYEGGPKPPGLRFIPDEFITQLETLISQHQREEALRLFMLRVAGLDTQELDMLQRSPAWVNRLASLHTIPRELRAINEYGTDLDRFKTLSVPALLLIGGQTEGRRRDMFLALSAVIPGSQLHELPGQGHAANTTAPELFASAMTEFLLTAGRATAGE
jgi:pimeloyl-ACP methyl ester carboxylesterase